MRYGLGLSHACWALGQDLCPGLIEEAFPIVSWIMALVELILWWFLECEMGLCGLIPYEVALSVLSGPLSRSCPKQETVLSMQINGLIPPTAPCPVTCWAEMCSQALFLAEALCWFIKWWYRPQFGLGYLLVCEVLIWKGRNGFSLGRYCLLRYTVVKWMLTFCLGRIRHQWYWEGMCPRLCGTCGVGFSTRAE